MTNIANNIKLDQVVTHGATIYTIAAKRVLGIPMYLLVSRNDKGHTVRTFNTFEVAKTELIKAIG